MQILCFISITNLICRGGHCVRHFAPQNGLPKAETVRKCENQNDFHRTSDARPYDSLYFLGMKQFLAGILVQEVSA